MGSNTTIVGLGIPGTPRGGLVTVQGDPAGTPIPVTGTIVVTPANNFAVVALASGTRGAGNAQTPNQSTTYGRAVQMVVSVTAIDPGATLSCTLQGIDSISGNPFNLTNAPNPIGAVGTFVYEVSNSTLASGGIVQRVAGMLPPTIRVNYTVAGGNVTFSISYNFAV